LSLILPGTGYCTPTPSDVVGEFHRALVQAMQTADWEDRISIIGPKVSKHFQVHTISRISLGRNWHSLTADQQSGYQALMRELITTTYASRFASFSNQVFTITGSEPITSNRMRVKSVLVTKSQTVTLDYQLQEKDGVWQMYDIVANGVSDLSLKRSNYSAMFKKGGLPVVEAELRRNIERNIAKNRAF
jgi:phospholipid transport system substrate-binding protein